MQALIFAPKYGNLNVFQPEAKLFCKTHGIDQASIHLFDNHKPLASRYAEVRAITAAYAGPALDTVCFFNHGWKTGMQSGLTVRNLAAYTDLLGPKLACTGSADRVGPVVCLYACSTGSDVPSTGAPGSGDNSFADRFRDNLCRVGAIWCRVIAHTAVAHATRCPNIIFMEGKGSPTGGIGGYKPITNASPYWGKFTTAMRGATKRRFLFPFETMAEFYAALGA